MSAAALRCADKFPRTRDESWDFTGTPASTGVYGVHPYPAMFHFLVVRRLVERYSKEGDWVLDPFMGSGVAAVECLAAGRNFVGYDINPLAVLIASVRTTLVDRRDVLSALERVETACRESEPEPFDFYNVGYWFDDRVAGELSKLRAAVFALEDERLRDFFKVAFSETVRRVSRTKYGEFKLVRRKDDPHPDVLGTFRAACSRNARLSAGAPRAAPHTRALLREASVLTALPVEKRRFDLVVTSPPYGDSRTTVAYGQFSRLPLQWLGLEERVDRTSLGSRPRAPVSGLPSAALYDAVERVAREDERRARDVFSFYSDLFDAVRAIADRVKPRGHVCFVVGNRRVKGEELPTDLIVAELFSHLGFRHVRTVVRAISNKRMPGKNSPTNVRGAKASTMKREYVIVLRRP